MSLHWASKNKDKWTERNAEWGAQRLRMIDFLEAEAKALGWVKAIEEEREALGV